MKFLVNGVEYPWDHTTLSLREARDIERVTEMPVAAALASFNGRKHADGSRGMDVYPAFLWIAMRKTDPAVTFDDVLDLDASAVREDWSDLVAEVVEDETPTPAPTDAAKRRSGSARKPGASTRK